MEIRAVQKFLVMSPRKLKDVSLIIKKLTPEEAFEKLPYVGKRAAEPLRKVIGTAIANAEQRGLNKEKLIFKEIQINQGPGLKRWKAGARGRAKPYKRRMSHIRIVLTTNELEAEKVVVEKGKEKVSENLKIKNPALPSRLASKLAGRQKSKIKLKSKNEKK